MATTEFYFSAGSGAAKSDGKTAVFDTKPNINGVQYDSIVLDDTQKRAQKTLNGQVLDLTPEEQTAVRNYAAQATTAVPADNSVVKTTPQTFTDAQKDQALGNLGLPTDVKGELDKKFDKTGGKISGPVAFDLLFGVDDSKKVLLSSGTTLSKGGAYLQLNGGGATSHGAKGGFYLVADGNEGECVLLGNPKTKKLIWDSHVIDQVVGYGVGHIRYASGVQVCWGSFIYTSTADWTQAGSLYTSNFGFISFAVPFIDSSVAVCASPSSKQSPWILKATLATSTGLAITAYSPSSLRKEDKISGSYIAIGYWK